MTTASAADAREMLQAELPNVSLESFPDEKIPVLLRLRAIFDADGNNVEERLTEKIKEVLNRNTILNHLKTTWRYFPDATLNITFEHSRGAVIVEGEKLGIDTTSLYDNWVFEPKVEELTQKYGQITNISE